MMTCRLCCLPKPLCDSHILPEFAYRRTYDENRQAIYLDLLRLKRSVRQRGFWEKLLCIDCEGKIGRWETYFAEIWYNRPVRPSTLTGRALVLKGIDYRKTKLLLLSILWRSSVSSLVPFRDVRLGPHEERLRALMDAADPGPETRYVIAALAGC